MLTDNAKTMVKKGKKEKIYRNWNLIMFCILFHSLLVPSLCAPHCTLLIAGCGHLISIMQFFSQQNAQSSGELVLAIGILINWPVIVKTSLDTCFGPFVWAADSMLWYLIHNSFLLDVKACLCQENNVPLTILAEYLCRISVYV